MEESGEIEELTPPVVPPEGEQSGAEVMTTECADQTMESEPPVQEELPLEENLHGGAAAGMSMNLTNLPANMNLTNLPTNLNLINMPTESPDISQRFEPRRRRSQ